MTYVTELGKKRLLRLADRLEKVAVEHFNIELWYNALHADQLIGEFKATKKISGVVALDRPGGEYGYQDDRFRNTGTEIEQEVLLDEGFCGSTACVLGHAAMIPEFNDAGLYIDVSDITTKIEETKTGERTTFYGGAGEVVYRDPNVKGARLKNHFDAGQEFFGLTEDQADMIFGGERAPVFYGRERPSPSLVAKKLRKFVETNGAYGDEVEAKYQKVYGGL